ncbi:peptidoglycan DD-metalloendopeptidase family protein [Paraburkholderia hospita]|uniref:peptidoglycan DD-metalloendopeptidase family protein n=1 Tax=Paraburkholderia hospita TaxID=169430 RepID=UPI0009DA8BF0|nr:M23 family metallopeptidase [Paraburkholderia hospita]OUL83280.1 hypothetical protein CA603_26425 [Paraburkholderia hospita]OUL86735.1 hypothetical protein CA602_15035 [Paraburkholderia hospita]
MCSVLACVSCTPQALVRAAAAGPVVYAGTGIRKHGSLVIIKHDDTFITARGHNSVLLVKDGDGVGRGLPIAEVGGNDKCA